VDVSGCPCEGAKIVSSMMRLILRLLGGMMLPVVAMNLPLEVVPALVVGCFFGVIARWRVF